MKFVAFYGYLWWTRFLDVVKPRRDYTGRPYPRVGTLTGETARRAEEILRKRGLL